MKAAINDFFIWWWQGLAWLLPITKQPAAPQYAPAILVQPTEAGFTLAVVDDGQSRAVVLFITADTLPTEIEAWVASTDLDNPQFVLRLPEHSVLAPQLTVAASRAVDVRVMLRFEIDRQTPFTAEQVYNDYYPIMPTTEVGIPPEVADQTAGGLRCALVVVPRSVLDQMLGSLDSLGIEIDLFDLDRARYQPLPMICCTVVLRLCCLVNSNLGMAGRWVLRSSDCWRCCSGCQHCCCR